MAKYKIEIDKAACIGCAACVGACPDNFEMDGEHAKVKKPELNDLGCTKAAAESCPVECIKITKQ